MVQIPLCREQAAVDFPQAALARELEVLPGRVGPWAQVVGSAAVETVTEAAVQEMGRVETPQEAPMARAEAGPW